MIYKEGTIVTAKVDPKINLITTKYSQPIYTDVVIKEYDRRPFAYFERKLIPHGPSNDLNKPYIMKHCIERLTEIIVISLKEILDNIYRILSRPPTCRSSLSFASIQVSSSGEVWQSRSVSNQQQINEGTFIPQR